MIFNPFFKKKSDLEKHENFYAIILIQYKDPLITHSYNFVVFLWMPNKMIQRYSYFKPLSITEIIQIKINNN